MRFSIICAVNKPDVLRENLLMSPGIENHEIIAIFGSKNVPSAYSRAAKMATEDILIFVHQDVYLPETFFSELESSISSLEGRNWGILGPIGTKFDPLDGTNVIYAGDMVDRGNRVGKSDSLPEEIQTLDEMMLICKKEDAIFDEEIPTTHHMHGSDVCMTSISKGKSNFAIKAFCYHNSETSYVQDPQILVAAEYIKAKWKDYLPICTTCLRLN